MTENKRFGVTDHTDNPYLCDWNVTDYSDGAIVHMPMTSEYMAIEICDLLNDLNDENQILKASNEEYEDDLGRLEEENNNLKNKLCVFNELNRPLGTIIEENRHLKAFIRKLSNGCGEIILLNGNVYNVKKILGEVE